MSRARYTVAPALAAWSAVRAAGRALAGAGWHGQAGGFILKAGLNLG
jgi:hypothetical protein